MAHYLIGKERKKAFAEMLRVCKKNGYIVLSLPYKFDLSIRLVLVLKNLKHGVNYELFTNKEIKQIFKNQKIIHISGFNWLGHYWLPIKKIFRGKTENHMDRKFKLHYIKRNKITRFLNNDIFLAKLFGTRLVVVQKQS